MNDELDDLMRRNTESACVKICAMACGCELDEAEGLWLALDDAGRAAIRTEVRKAMDANNAKEERLILYGNPRAQRPLGILRV